MHGHKTQRPINFKHWGSVSGCWTAGSCEASSPYPRGLWLPSSGTSTSYEIIKKLMEIHSKKKSYAWISKNFCAKAH